MPQAIVMWARFKARHKSTAHVDCNNRMRHYLDDADRDTLARGVPRGIAPPQWCHGRNPAMRASPGDTQPWGWLGSPAGCTADCERAADGVPPLPAFHRLTTYTARDNGDYAACLVPGA